MTDKVRARLERRGDTLKRFLRRARIFSFIAMIILILAVFWFDRPPFKIVAGVLATICAVGIYLTSRMLNMVMNEIPGVIGETASTTHIDRNRRRAKQWQRKRK